mmetsp:Transcript_3257/g.8814  ORF Transcript_3257/g.8814 Transcript_3257/m.8814 type:complete len:242 (-) Transcript_3257:290-1015(-)
MYHMVEHVAQLVGNVADVEPQLPDALHVVQFHPLHEFHGEDAGGREVPANTRRRDVVPAFLENVPAHLAILSLPREIQFPRQIDAHFLGEPGIIKLGEDLAEMTDKKIHRGDISAGVLEETGVLDLHGDLLAVIGPGGVDLRQGRRGDGLVVKVGEDLLRIRAKVAADDLADLLGGGFARLVLQRAHRLHVVLGDEKLERGNVLAQFDVHTPVLIAKVAHTRGAAIVDAVPLRRLRVRIVA